MPNKMGDGMNAQRLPIVMPKPMAIGLSFSSTHLKYKKNKTFNRNWNVPAGNGRRTMTDRTTYRRSLLLFSFFLSHKWNSKRSVIQPLFHIIAHYHPSYPIDKTEVTLGSSQVVLTGTGGATTLPPYLLDRSHWLWLVQWLVSTIRNRIMKTMAWVISRRSKFI